jgi:hypothetical protein
VKNVVVDPKMSRIKQVRGNLVPHSIVSTGRFKRLNELLRGEATEVQPHIPTGMFCLLRKIQTEWASIEETALVMFGALDCVRTANSPRGEP